MHRLTYNPRKQKVVLKFPGNDYRWFCSNCLTAIKDDFCKIGYTITCYNCKKEYEISKVEDIR